MRCDQMIGVTEKASNFLADNMLDAEECPCCHRPFPRKLETCGKFFGMYDNEHQLRLYRLKDGGYAEEFIQADPWSSGPCFFIGLKVFDVDGHFLQEFLWDQKDIDYA